jgi:hypothetical protein
MAAALIVASSGLIKVVPGLMIWTLIAFAITFFVLRRYAFGPIQSAIDARRERIRKLAVAESSQDYAIAAHRWLEKFRETPGTPEASLQEALDVVAWDEFLIHVKIIRALDGRDEFPEGDFRDQGPIQSDWNGSAKVATMCIDRSEHAWRVVAAATGDEAAGVLAEILAALRQQMSKEFPHAMEFRRPGFDDPPQPSQGG